MTSLGADVAATLSLLAAVGCAGSSVPPSAVPATPSSPAALVTRVSPSRLVPDLDPTALEPVHVDRVERRYLVSGMRIAVREDGVVARADERFPPGSLSSVELPERLGGGYLFYSTDGAGTRMWRATDWVASTRALASLPVSAEEVVPGFDRLYVRSQGTGGAVIALDAETGGIMPLGELPLAGGYGAMAFADGWRGVIDTEYAGPVASFDAGASWHPLGLAVRAYGAGVRDGDPVLYAAGGNYRLDARGVVQFVPDDPEQSAETQQPPTPALAPRERHTLGPHPLRSALLDGWPDTNDTAVLLHGGTLYRVALGTVSVLSTLRNAIPDREADCHGIRVGLGFGFVCGVRGGATTIYAFEAPFGLRQLARFDEPRFVAPSGNGAIVVRGPCSGHETAEGSRSYCIIGTDGATRPLSVVGEVGVERVVALSDGRTAVLVPPRSGAPGQVTVIGGESQSTATITLPDDADSKRAVAMARRGLWLEGFEERQPGVLAGWIEVGGPVLGVEVKLDGSAKVGELHEREGDVLFASELALAIHVDGTAAESTDGGMSWTEFELPPVPESDGDAATRGCTRLGCGMRGWLRVGWGPPANEADLREATPEDPTYPDPVALQGLDWQCSVVATSKDETTGYGGDARSTTGWAPFLGTAPPKLGPDDIGVDRPSPSYEGTASHVYVWGPKSADWERAGFWQIRFDDRFAVAGGARQSTPSRAPFSDEIAAADGIGIQRRGNYWRWGVHADPSGTAALLSACRSSTCALYAVADGRPIVVVRDASGGDEFVKPLDEGAVRVGEVWFFATEVGDSLEIWRVDLGVARRLGRLPRQSYGRYNDTGPRLVRRALGNQIGLMLTTVEDPQMAQRPPHWFVLPIDALSAEVGAPIDLGRTDFGGVAPPACGANDDGWLSERPPGVPSAVRLARGGAFYDPVEYRMRLDPGGRCIEAMAATTARMNGASEPDPSARRRPTPEPLPDGSTVPFAVSEQVSDRRIHLRCRADVGATGCRPGDPLCAGPFER